MHTKNALRALAIGAMATTMLVAAPAGQAKERHHRGASPSAVCARAAQSSELTADQKAAVDAACTQLKADVDAARAAFNDAVDAARAEVKQARDAVHAACADGQGDTQACHDARAAAKLVRRQAHSEIRAARRALKSDLRAALSTFAAAVKAAVGTPAGGSGDTPGGSGEGEGNHGSGPCGYLVSHAPADKQATLQAACDQLAADTSAAQAAFQTARQSALTSYTDASAALHAACEGQEDSQACTDARVAFEQALGQIHADLEAAETKLKSDLADALATFRSTLETVFGHPQGAGEPGGGG